MPIRTHYPEPPRALGYFQGSRRVLQAGLVMVAVSSDPLSLPDPKLHLSTLWHGHVSLLQVGKVRHRCAVSGLLSRRAESTLAWAERFLQAPEAICSPLPHPAQMCHPCSSCSTGASRLLSKCTDRRWGNTPHTGNISPSVSWGRLLPKGS